MGRLGMCLLLLFLTATSVAEAKTFELNREGKFVVCKREKRFLMNWSAELQQAARLASYGPLTQRMRPVATPTPMTITGREFQG